MIATILVLSSPAGRSNAAAAYFYESATIEEARASFSRSDAEFRAISEIERGERTLTAFSFAGVSIDQLEEINDFLHLTGRWGVLLSGEDKE